MATHWIPIKATIESGVLEGNTLEGQDRATDLSVVLYGLRAILFRAASI
jgi:hypothetical protein